MCWWGTFIAVITLEMTSVVAAGLHSKKHVAVMSLVLATNMSLLFLPTRNMSLVLATSNISAVSSYQEHVTGPCYPEHVTAVSSYQENVTGPCYQEHVCPNRSCLFAVTDTVDSQNSQTFSTRQIAFLVAELPMRALLLRLPL